MLLFYALILMHLVYDFHLQGEFVGLMKAKSVFILVVHCLTWAMLLSAVLLIFSSYKPWNCGFLFLTHYFIDFWKCRMCKDEYKLTWGMWLDQFLHLVTIIAVSL